MRPAILLTAGLLAIVAALVAAVYFWSPRANLRVTTGPPGSTAYRFITAFAAVTEANHPRVRIKLVQVADLAASAKAIEDHATDLGIVRSDGVIPPNGETIAILRRDVVAFVVPAKSSIDKIPSIAGKTIGIPQGPVQTYNEQTLDTILSYYNIPANAVKRVFLPIAEIGAAIHDKKVAAVLAVGPIGPGEVVDVVGAIKLATKGAPGILAIDEAEAINKRFPGLESIDVPAGAFRGRPPTPDDYGDNPRRHLPLRRAKHDAGRRGWSDRAIAFHDQSPAGSQNATRQSDRSARPRRQEPSLAGSSRRRVLSQQWGTELFRRVPEIFLSGGHGFERGGLRDRTTCRTPQRDLRQIDRLIELADKALAAQASELKALEEELNGIIAWFVKGRAGGTADSTAFSVAIAHAQHAIEKQREELRQGRTGSVPQPES